MTIALSTELTNEMNSLSRRPAGALTAEQFLPEWTEEVSGSGAVHYAHGHAACVAVDGNGAGEDILFRARVTAAGELQVCALKGAVLETPSNWDTLWIATGITGLASPNWVSDSGLEHGGSVAIAYASGSSSFRVFVFNATEVKHYDFDHDAALVGNAIIAALPAGDAMQLGACKYDECFIITHEQVEAGQAAWHNPVYGTKINRYVWNGSTWSLDNNPFLFHTHAEAHLVKDGPSHDSGSDDQVAQWGFRPCGGIGVINLNDDTALVVVGLRYYFRKAYSTHTQAVVGFFYHRDNGVWERAFDNDEADYDLEQQLWLDVFARGMQIDGRNIVTWVRLVEPADTEQVDGSEHVPRVRETVYACISDDGRHVTQFQYLGDPEHLASATIVAVNRDGTKQLYALGWQAVYSSDPAHFLCDVPVGYRFDMGSTATGYTTKRDSRFGMVVSSVLKKGADRFSQGLLREGNLLRAFNGAIEIAVTDINGLAEISTTAIEDGTVKVSTEAIYYASNIIEASNYSTSFDHLAFIRFLNVPFPQGAIITAAYIRCKWAKSEGEEQVAIYVEDSSNATHVTSYADYLSRSLLDPVTWSEYWTQGEIQGSPSLVSQIQDIANKLEWSSGNALQILIKPDVPQTVWRIESADSGVPCVLHLEWTIPGQEEVVHMAEIGQGFIDQTSPAISMEQRVHEGPINARAELQLLSTRAEAIEEILPMDTLTIEPVDPGGPTVTQPKNDDEPIPDRHPAGISLHHGKWSLRKPNWPSLFFSGQYPSLESGDKLVYRMLSFPWAVTGGGPVDLPVGVQGGPGDIADHGRKQRGTMFNDIVWTTVPSPRIDGAVQAAVRFGDDRNYGDFSFTALDGNYVEADIRRTNGLITEIGWLDANSVEWNTVAQESCMIGLICRSVIDPADTNGVGKKYAFVWEANSDFLDGSHLDDTALRVYGNGIFDKPDYSGVSAGNFSGAGRFYLLISDFDEEDEDWQANERWVHKAVAEGAATGLETGKPAELKLQVYGGTIYGFYRPYPTGSNPKQPWRHALTYNAGHFGAGRFGLVARGHSGIQWDVLWPGRNHIDQTDNVVDVWDVEVTDCEKDWTLEEVIKHFAYQGLTETEFRSDVSDDSRVVLAGTYYNGYNHPVENLCLDFTVTLETGGESGVFVRAVDNADPNADCVCLGLVANATYKEADNTVNCYLVKRRYHDGVEVLAARDYSPSVLHLKPNLPYHVRVSVRNDTYSVWVDGAHMGHFKDDTELGQYFGLYSTGAQATFTDVRLPELHEVPENAILDPNQAMMEAIKGAIGRRHIKGVWRPYGKLLVSQFKAHDVGPTLQDSLTQSTIQQSDRFYSVVEVQGAYTRATYVSPLLLSRGRRYIRIDNPDIMTQEACYREAKLICQEAAEQMEQPVFIGLPDLRIEPEDAITVVITQQGKNGTYLVDDVAIMFDLEKRQSAMQAGARRQIIL